MLWQQLSHKIREEKILDAAAKKKTRSFLNSAVDF